MRHGGLRNLLRFYLSPYGRISRAEFWLDFLAGGAFVGFVVWHFTRRLDLNWQFDLPSWAFFVAAAVVVWSLGAITTKRLHDRNMSGWWQLAAAIPFWFGMSLMLFFTPFVGGFLVWVFGGMVALAATGIAMVMIGMGAGTPGANTYGDDPLAGAGPE
jgi:uncharacterized membrane protein YhaH (DUF805 family)